MEQCIVLVKRKWIIWLRDICNKYKEHHKDDDIGDEDDDCDDANMRQN